MLDGGACGCARWCCPTCFIDHDSPAAMYARAGLDAKGIVAKVFEALGKDVQGRDGQARLRASPSALTRLKNRRRRRTRRSGSFAGNP